MPFRVFVSSPVTGIETFRYEIMSAARHAERSRKFEFFFFEHHENARVEGKTICESIFEQSGQNFDAFFVFFRDRVGAGTIEELDYFTNVILQNNPSCQLWWSQIYYDPPTNAVDDFLGRLHEHNTGLQVVPGEELNDKPGVLKGRFTAKLFETMGSIDR